MCENVRLSTKGLFPQGFPVRRHPATASLIWAVAGLADTRDAKALWWVGVINIPVDVEGEQNELVCDGSS